MCRSLRWRHRRLGGELTYFRNSIDNYIFRNPLTDEEFIERFPDDVRVTFTQAISLAPEMFTWLAARYLEHRSVDGIVDGLMPAAFMAAMAPPAVPSLAL